MNGEDVHGDDDRQLDREHDRGRPRDRDRTRGLIRLVLAGAVGAGIVAAASTVDGGFTLPGQSSSGADDSLSTSAAAAQLVESAVLSCPGPELLGVEGADATQKVTVGAAAAPDELREVVTGPGAGGADGEAGLQTTTDDRATMVSLEKEPVSLDIDAALGARLEAKGQIAAGLTGSQVSLSTEPGTRGLSMTPCTAADEDQWLVGGGGAAGQAEQVVLSNPGSEAVTVEISVWGADGPAPTTGGAGLVVPAHGRVVHLLDGLASGVESPVVRVESRGGPVVAHLGEHRRDGTVDLGAEVAPAVAAPASDLVIPAPPERGPGGELALRLVAPGDEEAIVELTALTTSGAVRLSGQVTRVDAGHTVDVPLDDLPDGLVALRVRSDVPVTGALRLDQRPSGDEPVAAGEDTTATTAPRGSDDDSATTAPPPGGARQGEPLVRPAGELAWTGATTLHRSPVAIALPDPAAVPGGQLTLAVTAVDSTTPELTWIDAKGVGTSQELDRIPNDTTVTVEVPDGARAVWVRASGEAGLAAAVHLQGKDKRGPFVASSALPPAPWTRSLTEIDVVSP